MNGKMQILDQQGNRLIVTVKSMKGRFWPEAAIGFAENHANRIAALRAEAAIGPTELSIAAFDPKPLSSFLDQSTKELT